MNVNHHEPVGRIGQGRPTVEVNVQLPQDVSADAKAVCIVPIAFVSEHVETLNEIDIQYRDIAGRSGITEFHRACAVKCHPSYIACLANQAEKALTLTPLVPAAR